MGLLGADRGFGGFTLMDFRSPFFGGHLTYEVEPRGEGSMLRQDEVLRLRWSLRWLSPVVERRLRVRLLQRLDDIKALLEADQQAVR